MSKDCPLALGRSLLETRPTVHRVQFAQARDQTAHTSPTALQPHAEHDYACGMLDTSQAPSRAISRESPLLSASPARVRFSALLVVIAGLVLALSWGGAGAATPAAAADLQAEAVESTTTLNMFATPTKYGDLAILGATVTLAGPANLSSKPIHFELDGQQIGSTVLIYTGGGKFSTLIPLTYFPAAGTHTLVARFDGTNDDSTGFALPSASQPLEFSVAQAPTDTNVTEAPSVLTAVEPVEVSAGVTSPVIGLTGEVSLYADSTPIAHAGLRPDGTVKFTEVTVPWGTTSLHAAFVGDAAGNFAASTSPALQVTVAAVDTTTTANLSVPESRADETTRVSAVVRNSDPVRLVDPRGDVQLLIDGAVAQTVTVGTSVADADGTSEASFEINGTDLEVGEHTVEARFVPEPGFAPSGSEQLQLQILGIETSLVASTAKTDFAPTEAILVSVTASTTGASGESGETRSRDENGDALPPGGSPVDGTVQAFVNDQPHGDPFAVTDGVGQAALPALHAGSHEIELRLTPSGHGQLASSTTLQITVTVPDEDGGETDGGETDGGETDGGETDGGETDGGDNGESGEGQGLGEPGTGTTPARAIEQPANVLGATGSGTPASLVIGGVVLLLGAGTLVGARRLNRRS